MSRRSGKLRRFLSRLFKERQIYHRSDGVVHFISMSTQTQIALSTVVGAALLWVAYASVNVVFKEQIIVAKERDTRIMEASYNKRINDAQRAYDDVSLLNNIIQTNFKETMTDIDSRHQMLQNMVERKSTIDNTLETLAEGLSEAGGPSGAKPLNGNRVMIDINPGEPTPRQSRMSLLRKQAKLEAERRFSSTLNGTPIQSEAVAEILDASADLYLEQTMLMALVEEKSLAARTEIERILNSTGVNVASLVTPAKISNSNFAQGGPFIDPALNDPSSKFFQQANRAAFAVDELDTLLGAVKNVPLSSPLTVSRRFTSGFGIRRDPINGRHSSHHGIDFSAAWASPITATANGKVKFAGTRSGFGRVVEIDHGNGFLTRYAHMHRISVKTGQSVKLHDKIGELGSSGRSTGPHVHYEILFRGKPLNPKRFIEAGRYVFES